MHANVLTLYYFTHSANESEWLTCIDMQKSNNAQVKVEKWYALFILRTTIVQIIY